VKACRLDDKVQCIAGNFITWLKEQEANLLADSLVIIDPPWGGSDYKYESCITDLYLENDQGK